VVRKVGSVLAIPQFLNSFNDPSDFGQAVVIAAWIVGECLGSLIISLTVSDSVGRRSTIVVTEIVYLLGQALIVAAQHNMMSVSGHVVNGLGTGTGSELCYYKFEGPS
jgi:MFS family permease